jgi:hypothetical protein
MHNILASIQVSILFHIVDKKIVQYVSKVATEYLATSAVTEQYYSFRIFFIYQVANELIKFQCVLAKDKKLRSIHSFAPE